MNKKLLHQITVFVFTLFVIAGSLGLVLWRSSNVRLYNMPDTSMAPSLLPGDLLLVTASQAIHVGDVVNYADPSNPRGAISRRATSIDPAKGVVMVQADSAAQPAQAVAVSDALGTTFKSVPLLGYGLDWLRRPAGLALLVYTPAFMIVRAETKRLRGQLGRQAYKLPAAAPVA